MVARIGSLRFASRLLVGMVSPRVSNITTTPAISIWCSRGASAALKAAPHVM
jgi:hypothetical protein